MNQPAHTKPRDTKPSKPADLLPTVQTELPHAYKPPHTSPENSELLLPPVQTELPHAYKPPHTSPENSRLLLELRSANPWASYEQLAALLEIRKETTSVRVPLTKVPPMEEHANSPGSSVSTMKKDYAVPLLPRAPVDYRMEVDDDDYWSEPIPDEHVADSEGSEDGLMAVSPLSISRVSKGAVSSERPIPLHYQVSSPRGTTKRVGIS